MSALKWCTYSVWLLACFYVGMGGFMALQVKDMHEAAKALPAEPVTRGAISYHNRESLSASIEEAKARTFFQPLFVHFPEAMLFLFTAMAFGGIGALTACTKRVALDNVPIAQLQVGMQAMLGCLVGMVVLGMAELVPTLLLTGGADVRPLALSFFSLLAGIFTGRFFDWLGGMQAKLFH